MKKLVSALLSTAAVGLLTFGTFASASAGELRLWEHDNYNGFYTTYGSCDVDFPDNIYDSGKQNLVDYVTIWNNTVFAGDKAIAFQMLVSASSPASVGFDYMLMPRTRARCG